MPHIVPGADLDAEGMCRFCRDGKVAVQVDTRPWREDLERTLRDVRGQGRYDAVVCLSGGKDSLYLLHRARVDYGLNVLAFTTGANLPDVAWTSIQRAVKKLSVDHIVYTPSDAFYRKLFAFLLRNQEARGAVYTVSYVYAPLFEGDALALATERGIPLVLAGYSPGQPEPERMQYEFSRKLVVETDWTPPALRESGEFSESELARFWNPRRYPAGTQFPRYLAPLHAWDYDQGEIIKEVHRLGLVARRSHASPVHSNYPINWLLMYSDLKRFGYNPYTPEFCTLIREGKARRGEWRLMFPLVDLMIRKKLLLGAHTKQQMKWLGLSDGDLKVTKTRGAYDPPLA